MKPSNLGVITSTSMNDINGHPLQACNSGIGLTQLPPGHTKISGNSAIASAGVAMISGIPGQFPQSTRMTIQDGFGRVLK